MAIYNDTQEIMDRIDDLCDMLEDAGENINLAGELEVLQDVIDEIGPTAKYNIKLIHESNIVDYAMALWEETTGHNTNEWPYTSIDWNGAADDLMSDYTMLEFDGETYYYQE